MGERMSPSTNGGREIEMPVKDKMRCLGCGQEMNHHADKIFYVRDQAPDAADPLLGGVYYEVHTCSSCGETATRRAG
jgi:ribosomal protein L37AE/L43A